MKPSSFYTFARVSIPGNIHDKLLLNRFMCMCAHVCTRTHIHTHTHTQVPHCLCSLRAKNWPNLTSIIYAPLPSCFMLVYLSTSCCRMLARKHAHTDTHTPPYLFLHAAPTDKDILLPQSPRSLCKISAHFKGPNEMVVIFWKASFFSRKVFDPSKKCFCSTAHFYERLITMC